MRTIALLSCGKSKLSMPAPAQHLYIGNLFQKSLAYARHRNADGIYILSAKYGLVELDQVIEPYEKTLNKMPANEVNEWADHVLLELRSRADFAKDTFILLAGDKYRSLLVPHLKQVEIPLEGLGIGIQLSGSIHKFAHVFFQAASAFPDCDLRSKRFSSSLKSLRVNFHSKGLAMAS